MSDIYQFRTDPPPKGKSDIRNSDKNKKTDIQKEKKTDILNGIKKKSRQRN